MRERTARERQPHRIPRAWLVLAALAGAVWLGAALVEWSAGETVEARVRRTFGITGQVDSATIRDTLLRRFPLGTPESRLEAYVARQHVGSDGANRYLPAGAGTPAVVRVDSKPGTMDWATSSYLVSFEFDAARHLSGIRVQRGLTGP